jgi:hypothetical protein
VGVCMGSGLGLNDLLCSFPGELSASPDCM